MRFRFVGGDGDPSFFGEMPFVAQRVDRVWFPRVLSRGEAFLLEVEDGKFASRYLAITSRLVASLSEQVASEKYVSVVAHLLSNTGEGFSDAPDNVDAVGMATIEVAN
jgi:hypothetical protein